VTVAGTLAEAKRACDAQTFDVMVCDLELPDGDGVELLQYARRTCDMAGVVMSGHGGEYHRQAARAAGFNEYLIKPVPFQGVEDAIRRAAGR
jgi:two-component system response regulator YesN